MNQQIFSKLGAIGASPYMAGTKRLNSQYAGIETLYGQRAYAGCVAACSVLFEQLMDGLYRSVMGQSESLPVILSDIAFWAVVDDKTFCDKAGMLQYACSRIKDEPDGGAEPEKSAKLAKSGLEDIIVSTERFLTRHGEQKCLDPRILKRDDIRNRINDFAALMRRQLEGAGCSDGLSMQPPFMNAFLLDFPERETKLWAHYLAEKLRQAGLLTDSEIRVLDAEQVVDERVGLTNEFIRRAAAGGNGGALLIEHFEEFDMPCLGGNLLDRAMRTTFTAAERYRGSLSIVVAGHGKNFASACRRDERSEEYFPLLLALESK